MQGAKQREGSTPVDRRVPRRLTSRILSDGSLTKRASLNAAASAIDHTVRIGLKLLLTPFLVSRLGDSLFGIWQVLRGMIDQTAPASGRPGEALKWTVAHDQSSTDVERKRRHVGNAVGVWLMFLPLVVAIGGVLGWFSPVWLDVPASRFAEVRLAAGLLLLDLVLAGLVYLPQSVLQGENMGYKRLGLSTSLIFVGGGFLAIAVALGTGIVGMAIAVATTTLLAGAVYVYIARSRVPWFGIARPTFQGIRAFAGLSWWFLLWNFVMRALQSSDVVLIGITASPALATTYALTRYVPQAVTVAAALMLFSIMPGLGGVVGSGDLGRAARIRFETMSLVWVMTTVAGASVLLWEESFLDLWVGERYYPGPAAMLAIVVMVLQFAIIRTDSNIIDLTLSIRRKVLLGAFSAGLSLLLGWVLLGPLDLGLFGLVVGFIAGRSVLSVGYPLMVGRLLGIPVRRQIRGLVRGAAVTVGLFAVAAMLGPHVLVHSWVTLIPMAVISAVVVGAVAMFGGLSPLSRRRVVERIRKVARLS